MLHRWNLLWGNVRASARLSWLAGWGGGCRDLVSPAILDSSKQIEELGTGMESPSCSSQRNGDCIFSLDLPHHQLYISGALGQGEVNVAP